MTVAQVPLETGKVTLAENQGQSPQKLNLQKQSLLRQSLQGLGLLLGATNIAKRQGRVYEIFCEIG